MQAVNLHAGIGRASQTGLQKFKQRRKLDGVPRRVLRALWRSRAGTSERACSRAEAEAARRARLELDHQRLDLPQAPRVAGQAAPAEVQQRLGAKQARLPLRSRRARVSAPCASPCMRPASTGLCERQRTGVGLASPSCQLRSCCACGAGRGGQRLPRRRRLLPTWQAAALVPQLSEGEQGAERAGRTCPGAADCCPRGGGPCCAAGGVWCRGCAAAGAASGACWSGAGCGAGTGAARDCTAAAGAPGRTCAGPARAGTARHQLAPAGDSKHAVRQPQPVCLGRSTVRDHAWLDPCVHCVWVADLHLHSLRPAHAWLASGSGRRCSSSRGFGQCALEQRRELIGPSGGRRHLDSGAACYCVALQTRTHCCQRDEPLLLYTS